MRTFFRLSSILIPLFATLTLSAQSFESHFTEQTLRLDLIFAGNASEQFIAIKELACDKGWYGRRCNLDSAPLAGNGAIILREPESGAVIYKHTFSSLFQEWLATDEAKGCMRSFEATLLLPMPRKEVEIEITLTNYQGGEQARLEHKINPADPLIRDLSRVEPIEHEYIHHGGASERAIDVVIIAEGYTKEQMSTFMEDARTAAEEILRYAPFKAHRSDFNFIAIKSESLDTNVSVPQDKEWRETAVNSNFMTFYAPRYLTTNSVHRLYDTVRGIPCEHIIVLANTDTYGGGGIYNSYTLTTAHHSAFKPVVVHEFGHSFGGLGDEYFYETEDVGAGTYSFDHEPWEPNITTLVEFQSKWADMLPNPEDHTPTEPTTEREESYTVGIYDGGGYVTRGVYRPAVVCRMRNNTATRFCPVCERAIERVILHQTVEK